MLTEWKDKSVVLGTCGNPSIVFMQYYSIHGILGIMLLLVHVSRL